MGAYIARSLAGMLCKGRLRICTEQYAMQCTDDDQVGLLPKYSDERQIDEMYDLYKQSSERGWTKSIVASL